MDIVDTVFGILIVVAIVFACVFFYVDILKDDSLTLETYCMEVQPPREMIVLYTEEVE